MGKIKLYDIAKELNLTSKEVLERAQELNIEAKSHLSGLDEEQVKLKTIGRMTDGFVFILNSLIKARF